MDYLDGVTLNLAGKIVDKGFRKELELLNGWKKVRYWGHVDRKQAAHLLTRSRVAAGYFFTRAQSSRFATEQNLRIYVVSFADCNVRLSLMEGNRG